MTFAYRMQENGAPATKEKLCILCEGSSDALFIALEREALQPHPESEWDKSTRDPDSRPVMETFKAHHIWTWGFTTSILVSLGNFHRTKRCNISTLWITNVCSESYCKNRCKPSSAKQMQQKEKPLLIVLRLWNCKELQVFCIILDWGNFKGLVTSAIGSDVTHPLCVVLLLLVFSQCNHVDACESLRTRPFKKTLIHIWRAVRSVLACCLAEKNGV